MSAAVAEPGHWSPRRLGVMIFLIFVTQLALIFWLSDRKPRSWRQPANAPALALLPARGTPLLALEDPTLFAMPRAESFSGLAWLKPPPTEYHPFFWTEDLQFLALSAGQLGSTFREFVGSNSLPQPSWVAGWSEPMPTPAFTATLQGPPTQSAVQRTGGLAERQWMRPPDLTNFANAELLTNSVVRMVVAADGKPISFTLLISSGLTAADRFALDQARVCRFEPLPEPQDASQPERLETLSWGELVFEWSTLPLPATNGAGAP